MGVHQGRPGPAGGVCERFGVSSLRVIMQPKPSSEATTGHYPVGSFRREDESDDRLFYAQPRLVVHVDEFALEAIGRYFGRVLPQGGVILDLI